MLRGGFLVLAALVLGIGVAGCGGGGEKTFDVEEIGVTFHHPAKFKPLTNVTFGQTAGAKPAARAGVALDRVISQLAGKSVSGREVEYGGLPGYEYVIALKNPADGQSRLAVLFDQATEYLINCQSTPEKRDAVESACRTALDSLATK